MNDTAAVATFAAEVAKVINSKAEWKAKVAWRKPLSDAFKKSMLSPAPIVLVGCADTPTRESMAWDGTTRALPSSALIKKV